MHAKLLRKRLRTARALRLAAGLVPDPEMPPRARWPLDEAAMPLVGGGAKGARV